MITKRKLRVQKSSQSHFATPTKAVVDVMGLPVNIYGKYVNEPNPVQTRALREQDLRRQERALQRREQAIRRRESAVRQKELALKRKEMNQQAGSAGVVGPNAARRERLLALVEKLQSPERTELLDKIYQKFARAF